MFLIMFTGIHKQFCSHNATCSHKTQAKTKINVIFCADTVQQITTNNTGIAVKNELNQISFRSLESFYDIPILQNC